MGGNNSSTAATQVNFTDNQPSSQRIKDGIIDSIQRLWRSEQRRDLTVIIDNVEIKCHSFLLCACSQYFERRLHPRPGATTEMTVTFNSFSSTTFQTILEALYTGTDVITSSNVLDVWCASNELQISFLIQECEEFVLENLLNVRTFGEIYSKAVFLRSTRVLQKTSEMIQTHFEAFIQCPAFLELTYDDFLKIVSSQDLQVTSEDIVINAILKWVEHVPDNDRRDGLNQNDNVVERNNYLGTLLSASRLSLVSPDCNELLMACETVKENREAKEVLERALLYKLLVGRRHGQWPRSAVHRNNSDSENVVVAGLSEGHISVLSMVNQKWRHFKPASVFNNCYVSIVVFDNTLYAFANQRSHCILHSGTANNDGQAQRLESDMQNSANDQSHVNGQLYVFKDVQWQKITDVPGAEYILIPHGESLYFLHPITKKVKKLDCPFEGSTLLSIEDIPSEGTIESAFAFEKSILVFCEKPENPSEEATVHCLDTVTKKWKRLNNLRGPAQLISVKTDKDMYILQNDGRISQIMYTYGGWLDFRYISTLWNCQWQLCGAVSFGYTLYICGRKLDTEFAAQRSVNLAGNQIIYHESSLTGVFESIIYINDKFDFFQPIILPRTIQIN